MAHILVVDDDERICKVFNEFLSGEGHEPEIASNAAEALESVRAGRPDLVLMDVRMPGTSGLEALQMIRQVDSDIHVVIMTAYGTSQTSIEAMRLGAYDYLIKPLDLHELKKVINSALEARALSHKIEDEDGTSDGLEKYSMVNLVGSTPRMQEAYKLIGILATNTVPALLVGERGVGKHLVARTIHANSDRRKGPFAAVYCQSLPAADLELEIFGSEESDPLTGRVTRTPGQLDAARGGTLFLDDIEVLPMNLQSRLLRVLTERGNSQRGASGEPPTNTRVITATEFEVRLSDQVREGSFNQGLFQHLNTLSIHLPPLRKRLEDLPDLVMHFIRRYNSELDKSLRGVDDRVMERMRAYSWPGNVGELDRVIKRAAVLARGDAITAAEFDDQLGEASFVRREDAEVALELAVRRCFRHGLREQEGEVMNTSFHDIVQQVETILVNEALAEASGNQVRAATLLGLNRTTLRKKMGL
ncbi:MAG: sigma-54-dependent Fis family transcriptional regulator [Deltaproteobacteria bacterium]|nr:sigma-54-dependent Fis family transcriptional regulator [Deltaproteobacteria bacterium]